MKILQINSVCGIGSTGRIASDIHNFLIENGHESYVAYGRGIPMYCNNAIKIGNKIDTYKHVALTRLFDKHGFGSEKATQKFINEIERLNPDVIHLHNIHGYYINVKILFDFLKKSNKTVIWTLHDCWSFTGHCAHFDYIGCKKWRHECNNCPQLRVYPASLMMDSSKSNYLNKKEIFSGVKNLTVVTPTNWLANLVKKSFMREYPIKIINNGIDLETFKPTDNKFRKKYNIINKFIVLGVANVWNDRKGFDTFIKLSKLLDDNYQIVLVGLSKKQIEKLPQNIIGISRTKNVSELVDFYSGADVFVNPTLEEVMGLTNVESLACGTPVITYNTGGSIECIDEDTGFIVDKGNVDELVNVIHQVRLNGKSLYYESCITRANKYYNKNNRIEDYFKLYNN